MHELSVCQGMLHQVDVIAAEHAPCRVTRIIVRIGPLSGVEPALLAQAFPLASAGTVASDAELQIENLPVRVHCETCGEESDAAANRLLCGFCGDWHTRLVSGDELLLASVELENEEHSGNTQSDTEDHVRGGQSYV
jgi:hydrogenase nickel incorporation protein HypA/HybF